MGGIYRKGPRDQESYSLLNMYPVEQGHHRVSLYSTIGGMNNIHGFRWVDGMTCIGLPSTESNFLGSLSPDECAVKCREFDGCTMYSSELRGRKECRLYVNYVELQCRLEKAGWMVGIREKRGVACGTVKEGDELNLACPKGQVISEITSADFGYLEPLALLEMTSPEISDNLRAWLYPPENNDIILPGKWTVSQATVLGLAAFGTGESALVMGMNQETGKMYSKLMYGLKDFNAKLHASPQPALTGLFGAERLSGAAVLGNAPYL